MLAGLAMVRLGRLGEGVVGPIHERVLAEHGSHIGEIMTGIVSVCACGFDESGRGIVSSDFDGKTARGEVGGLPVILSG